MSDYEYQPTLKSGNFDACVELIRQKHPIVIGGINNGTADVISTITAVFNAGGYPICKCCVDVAEYKKYVSDADYKAQYPDYYRDNFFEKTLEHYLAYINLELKKGDVFIDVASENSPMLDIYERLFQVRGYRQDIMYPLGVHNNMIGGDACHMPIPDRFADKIALTCSLEHFEGAADSLLIREIDRVLKPGGIAYIVPFYLFNKHAMQTDPQISAPNNVAFDEGAIVYCCKGWGNRHGRFYDFNAFKERIVPYLGSLVPEIQNITNISDVHPSCYSRFTLKLTKSKGLADKIFRPLQSL